MKIALLSRARTCSSPVARFLSKKYHNNQNDLYHEIYTNVHKDMFSPENKLKSKVKSNNNFENFSSNILDITQSLHSKTNFVCKLWARMLIFSPHFISDDSDIDILKNNIIFNITDYFRIKNYDKIYILDRDLLHSTLSYLYGNQTRLWHKAKVMYKYPIITLNELAVPLAKFYILEYCLYEKMKAFVINNNLPHTNFTEFDELKNDDVLLPSHNDYYKLITNYDSICNMIQPYYEYCLEKTQSWHYY